MEKTIFSFLLLFYMMCTTDYNIEDIEIIEQLEDFEDEYVYDLEVDETHTFFANDILVHNSIYVEFNRIILQLGIPKERELQFVLDLWEKGLGPYLEKQYDKYAEDYKCDKNLQALELEKVATTSIMVAKKHYTMMEGWKEPNVYLEPGEDIIYKGLELIQGSCPEFIRKCHADFYKRVHMWYIDHNTNMGFTELFSALRKYKQDFMMQKPDDICKGATIGDYEKFIMNDTTGIVVGPHCPIHVKGAGIANFMLNKNENRQYKAKYNKIKTRDKVKFYYTTDPNYPVFAFLPGEYPLEYAPPIDYNKQFENLILTPLNKVLSILKHPELTPDLCFTTALF